MAELFQSTVANINIHIRNILEEGEQTPGATIKEYLIVQQEGTRRVRRPVKYYNLPMIIAERADATLPNMGLTAWKGAKVRRGDVTIAKNYLNEEELRSLNRIVTRLKKMMQMSLFHPLIFTGPCGTVIRAFGASSPRFLISRNLVHKAVFVDLKRHFGCGEVGRQVVFSLVHWEEGATKGATENA